MEHLSFQVEAFSEVIKEGEDLFHRHWEELALDKDEVPLAPNWGRYAELEAAGALSAVTARQNGKLVGYSFMFLFPGLHYKTCFEARMDIFWLAPEVRGRMGGVRLFRAVEKELRRRGVQRVYVGSKLHQDVGRLFLALGYHPIETWYSKMLESG
jgi:GNAT superfamily N-acetyltransferase